MFAICRDSQSETDCILFDSSKMSPEKVCLDLRFSYLRFNFQSYLQESASSNFLIESAWLEICLSAIIWLQISYQLNQEIHNLRFQKIIRHSRFSCSFHKSRCQQPHQHHWSHPASTSQWFRELLPQPPTRYMEMTQQTHSWLPVSSFCSELNSYSPGSWSFVDMHSLMDSVMPRLAAVGSGPSKDSSAGGLTRVSFPFLHSPSSFLLTLSFSLSSS